MQLDTANRWSTLGQIARDVSYLDAWADDAMREASDKVPAGYQVVGKASDKNERELFVHIQNDSSADGQASLAEKASDRFIAPHSPGC